MSYSQLRSILKPLTEKPNEPITIECERKPIPGLPTDGSRFEALPRMLSDLDLTGINEFNNLYIRPNALQHKPFQIDRCRSFFVHVRRASEEVALRILNSQPIVPTLATSGPLSLQMHWYATEPTSTESWIGTQRLLACHFPGTKNLLDPRLAMPLPGSLYTTPNGHTSLIKTLSFRPELRYTVDEMLDAFEGYEPVVDLSNHYCLNQYNDWENVEFEQRATEWRRRHLLGGLLTSWIGRVMSPGTAKDALELVNNVWCDPPLSRGELDLIVREVFENRNVT